jgi:hypothetical protein
MNLREFEAVRNFQFLTPTGEYERFAAMVKLRGGDELWPIRGNLSWHAINAIKIKKMRGGSSSEAEHLARVWIEDSVRAGFLNSQPASSKQNPGYFDLGTLAEGQVEGLLTRF